MEDPQRHLDPAHHGLPRVMTSMRAPAIAAVATALLAATPAAAQKASPDRIAILATVEALLDAENKGDADAMRALIYPGGTAAGIGCGPDGVYGSNFVQPLEDFADSIGSSGGGTDRLYYPTMRLDGNFASVWGQYEYRYDGKLLHRGHASFELVRDEGKWKVLNYSWSTQPEECPGE